MLRSLRCLAAPTSAMATSYLPHGGRTRPGPQKEGISVEACYKILSSWDKNLRLVSDNQHKLQGNQLTLQQNQVGLKRADAEITAAVKEMQNELVGKLFQRIAQMEQGQHALSTQIDALASVPTPTEDKSMAVAANEAFAVASKELRDATQQIMALLAYVKELGVTKDCYGARGADRHANSVVAGASTKMGEPKAPQHKPPARYNLRRSRK